MGELRQGRDRPSRAQRRHLVNEDADGIALGAERRDETLTRLIEHLLEGVGERSRRSALERIPALLASDPA